MSNKTKPRLHYKLKYHRMAKHFIVANGWMQIRTAPKDQRILLWYPRPLFNKIHVIAGQWQRSSFARKTEPYWKHDLTEMFGVNTVRKQIPTHWQPLPGDPNEFIDEGEESDE